MGMLMSHMYLIKNRNSNNDDDEEEEEERHRDANGYMYLRFSKGSDPKITRMSIVIGPKLSGSDS